MNNNILNRIEKLESVLTSNDLIIYATTDKGKLVEEKAKKVLTADGQLKKGFSGIGKGNHVVVKGNNLEDVDTILKYIATSSNPL